MTQFNYDAKKNNDPDFKPRGAIQKVSVGAGGEAYGIWNAKSAQKTMTQFQNIFEEDVPKAEEEVRKDIGTFKEFEFKTIYTDDSGEFIGVCYDYLEDADPKNEAGAITKIQHIVFAPSTGTKRRLGVVERLNRTFRDKYVTYAKNMKK